MYFRLNSFINFDDSLILFYSIVRQGISCWALAPGLKNKLDGQPGSYSSVLEGKKLQLTTQKLALFQDWFLISTIQLIGLFTADIIA